MHKRLQMSFVKGCHSFRQQVHRSGYLAKRKPIKLVKIQQLFLGGFFLHLVPEGRQDPKFFEGDLENICVSGQQGIWDQLERLDYMATGSVELALGQPSFLVRLC